VSLGGRKPSMLQAGAYSAKLHYLKAAASLGAEPAKTSGRAVMERMKEMSAEDVAYGPASGLF
jgi:branched-chain amino acid transport system substrate-binding protein